MSVPPDMRDPLPSPAPGTAPRTTHSALPGTPLAVPADVQRWGQRFGAGAHMLWHLFGVLRSQPATWRSYLRVCILQAAVTLALALVVVDKSGLTDLVEEAPPPPPPLPRVVASLGPVAVGAPSFQPGTAAGSAEELAILEGADDEADEAAQEAAASVEEQLAEAAEAGDEARMKHLSQQLVERAMRRAFRPREGRAPAPPVAAPVAPGVAQDEAAPAEQGAAEEAAPAARSGAGRGAGPDAPPREGSGAPPQKGPDAADSEEASPAVVPPVAVTPPVPPAPPAARTLDAPGPVPGGATPEVRIPAQAPREAAPEVRIPAQAPREESAESDEAERLASLARTQAVLQQLQLRLAAKDPEGARVAAAQLRAALASMRLDARAVKAKDATEDLEKAARRARQAERVLRSDPTGGAIAAGALLEGVGERVVRAGAAIEEAEEALQQKAHGSRWRRALALLASLYATLFTMQYVVLALSREYHDAITRQLSLAVGLEPEDPDIKPRIRLNLRWVRTKMVRRVRSFIAFLPGLVLAAIASTLASIALAWTFPFFKQGVGAFVSQALTFVWAAYWWTVFTAGKSARAWTEEGRAPAPAFLRRLEVLTQTSPVFRWWGPRLFCRMALACSRSFYSPAAAVDRQPLEFAGLAAVRALALVPLFKLFIRPLAPVASAQLLAAQGIAFPTARPARDETARDARGD